MAASSLTVTLGRLASACSHSILRPSGPGADMFLKHP
ncbi:MRPL21 isoform 5 [Pan troglodytes]|uniref:Mitochondrial ribosomal protein L21 n=2 Tax=Homininae TaxID=207598 RepID=F5H3L0_HUMAN|nr:MRPL21 isoform 5 [Pan troglodytes]